MQREDDLHRDEHGDHHDAAGGATLPQREVRDWTDVPHDAEATAIRTSRVRQQIRSWQARALAAVYPVDGGLLVQHRGGVPRPRHVCSGREVA